MSEATVRMTWGAWKVPPHRQLAANLVEGGDALAGLQRRGMNALVGDQLLDGDLGLAEGGIGFVERIFQRRGGEDGEALLRGGGLWRGGEGAK